MVNIIKMIILGIDPGYERLGIAVVEKNEANQKEKLLFSECFKTSAKLPHFERLKLLGAELNKIISAYQPEILAIETLFLNTNQKTAMMVAEARGAIIYEAARHDLTVAEFSPPQIKLATTGNGRADKNAIIKMIPLLIKIDKEIKYDDEFDAIAVALTSFAILK